MNTAPVISQDCDLPTHLRTLSDCDLLSRTSQLSENERATTLQLHHHLNEIARRKLYLELGYGSLHGYCTRRLRYSSSSACRRIQAARCIRQFPQVLPLLAAGELDLATVCIIENVLTEENCDTVLSRVRGRPYRVVKRVAADYGAPVVDVMERIEPVRAFVTPSDIDRELVERELDRARPFSPVRSNESWVVSEQKMQVKFLASDALIEKVEQVKALLSSRNHDASFAQMLEVLLDEYIERHSPEARQRRREAKHGAKQPSSDAGGKSSTVGADGDYEDGAASSRYIPADVRDDVFVRDGAQCTYVAPSGTRCESRHGLQIDHIRPWAAGGTHDARNLRLLCAAHNRLAAEQTLGKHVMGRHCRRL